MDGNFSLVGPIRSQPKDSPSQTVKVPLYYTELAQFLRDDYGIFRIVSLPSFTRQAVRGAFVVYHWQNIFVGTPSLDIWSGKSSLRPLYRGGKAIDPLLDAAMQPQSKIISQDTWRALLQIANVRYVTYHQDTDWEYLRRNDPMLIGEKIYKFITESPYLKKIKTFGKIELYELDPKVFLPRIYSATSPAAVAGGFNDLSSLITLDDFQTKNGVFFLGLLKNKQKRFVLSKSDEKFVTNTPAVVKSKGKEYAVDNYVVPEEGRYEILVKVKDELKNRDLKALSVKMSGVAVTSEAPIFRPDGWISLGDFNLKKGGHQLSVYAIDKKGEETLVQEAYSVLRKCKPANNVPPKISFRKINPTRYIVKVEKAVKPFFLIFSESYHPQWKAYLESGVGSEESGDKIVAEHPKLGVKEARHEMSFTPGDISYLFAKPISDENHFLVNGYANAWYIDPKKVGTGNFSITLYFWPQSLFYLGLGISLITLICCLSYLLWQPLIRRIVKH